MNQNIVNILVDILGEPKKINEVTTQISFDCPYCAMDKGLLSGETDGKGNLEINLQVENSKGYNGVYKCWVCSETNNTKGSLFSLIKKRGNKSHVTQYINELNQYEKDLIFNNSTPLTKPTIDEYDEVQLYYEQKEFNFRKLNEVGVTALNYLNKRGITNDMIERYKIRYCDTYTNKNYLNTDVKKRSFYGRIFFPSFDVDGNVNYFVARDFMGKNSKYKYQNPEKDKNDYIFNEYFINWDSDIYLVEGVTDHIVTPNSIPLLGKDISNLLFNKLQENANANIIIFLDSDATKNAIKLYDILNINKLIGRVRIIFTNNNSDMNLDPSKINEFWGRKGIIKYIQSQRKITNKDRIEY
jgi:DNA primase